MPLHPLFDCIQTPQKGPHLSLVRHRSVLPLRRRRGRAIQRSILSPVLPDMPMLLRTPVAVWACCCALAALCSAEPVPTPRHLLYVATPGIRAETQYGGTGIAIF